MPGKPRSVKNSAAKPPTLVSNSQASEQKTASGLNSDAEDQFELELCWCIQQLETGTLKPQDKVVKDVNKTINILKSNNASLIKKRQIMRNVFGDYRLKMAEEEKKFSKSSSTAKFIPAVKKVSLSRKNESHNQSILGSEVRNEKFTFNFPEPNT